MPPYEPMICDYIVEELRKKFIEKYAELFLTGDKDFLESSVSDPRIVSVATFLDM